MAFSFTNVSDETDEGLKGEATPDLYSRQLSPSTQILRPAAANSPHLNAPLLEQKEPSGGGAFGSHGVGAGAGILFSGEKFTREKLAGTGE